MHACQAQVESLIYMDMGRNLHIVTAYPRLKRILARSHIDHKQIGVVTVAFFIQTFLFRFIGGIFAFAGRGAWLDS